MDTLTKNKLVKISFQRAAIVMTRRNILPWIVAVLAGSQASAEAVRITTDPFVEKVYENSEISGTLVVGLSQVAGSLTEELRISAEVPKGWSNLCLSVTTVDGLYEARNEYVLPEGWSGGEVIFDYPTAHSEKLLGTGADKIGTLVQRGPCLGQNNDFALSGWRVSEASKGALKLYVNAFQADEVIAYVGNEPEVSCTPLKEGSRAAFDMVCDLLLSKDTQSPVEIELIRIRSGRVEAASPISLEW
jgi:hypothetical protein